MLTQNVDVMGSCTAVIILVGTMGFTRANVLVKDWVFQSWSTETPVIR